MTNFSDKYLKPDIFTENETFDQYCAKIPELYLKSQVPEDVRQSFQVIESLTAFAYFNHKFIDVALTSALHTFEMAMKFKYKELTPKKANGFKGVLSFLNSREHFEVSNEVLKYYEEWRNQHAHPERYTTGGLMFLYGLAQICRLINDLYEDVTLRKERIILGKHFFAELKSRYLTQYLEFHSKDYVGKLFRLKLIFINNKQQVPIYTLGYIPLFTLGTQPEIYLLKVINPRFDAGSLIAYSPKLQSEIRICVPNIDSPNVREFKQWSTAWNLYDKSYKAEYEIEQLLSFCFISTINEFYKME